MKMTVADQRKAKRKRRLLNVVKCRYVLINAAIAVCFFSFHLLSIKIIYKQTDRYDQPYMRSFPAHRSKNT
jgi:hypothetical protein